MPEIFYYPSANPDPVGVGRMRLQIVDKTKEGEAAPSFDVNLQINPTSLSTRFRVTGLFSINTKSFSVNVDSAGTKAGEWSTVWSDAISTVAYKSPLNVKIDADIIGATIVSHSEKVMTDANDPDRILLPAHYTWHPGQTSHESPTPVVWEENYEYYKYIISNNTVTTRLLSGTATFIPTRPENAPDPKKKESVYADSGVLEAVVLDENFDAIGVIDIYESFIWTERFAEAGDFELYTRVEAVNLNIVKVGRYLTVHDSDTIMVIEAIKTVTDADDGNHLQIVGRSAESLLERRIVWSRVDISGSVQDGIREILAQNVIIPDDYHRRIKCISYTESFDDRITGLTMEGQYTGNNIYELIKDICEYYKIGFRMPFDRVKKLLYFELYKGLDRSFSQNVNPYMVFSRNFDNMYNSEYLEDSSEYRNVTIVFGKEATSVEAGVDASINSGYFTVVTGNIEAEGLNRRELLSTDSSSASSDDESLPTSDIKPAGDSESGDSDDKLPDPEYADKLRTSGDKNLSDCKYVKRFTSEADSSGAILYGRDYALGDIVEFVSDYGVESRARITEIIRSQDENGYKLYPTFLCIDEETEHTSGTVSK